MEYVKVISDYNTKEEINRLLDMMKKETDEEEKIKILEQISLNQQAALGHTDISAILSILIHNT